MRHGNKLWIKIKPSIKAEFERAEITRCEVCGGTFALSFAHRKKRRMIEDEQEMRQVALLCQEDHTRIEHSGHKAMFEAITKIIEERDAII